MKRSGPNVRIVNVSSVGHTYVKSVDWELHYGGKVADHTAAKTIFFTRYIESKLMNIWHARELARRLEGTSITTYSLHPGVVSTGIWRVCFAAAFSLLIGGNSYCSSSISSHSTHAQEIPVIRWLAPWFMVTEDTGANTMLYCAADRALDGVTGRYYVGCKEVPPTALALDSEAAADCWRRSMQLLQLEGDAV
jgi:retinol dehydrogenase 12